MTNEVNDDVFEKWAKALALWAPPGSEQDAEQSNSDGWAAFAEWWRGERQRFDPDKDPFLKFLQPWLTPTAVVLDVGAGTGRLSFPIAAKVKKVIAVEASPAMQEALNEGVASQGIHNVEVFAGRWPDVEVGRVDVVVCANVLYDVADLRPFLVKLDDVADRACFISLTSMHPYASLRELWQEFRGWKTPSKPTYEDAVGCLKQIGIKPHVEVMETQQPLSFSDLEQGVAFARRRLRLPDDPALITRLRTYLSKRGEEKDGHWLARWKRSQGIVLWWEKP